MASPQWAADWAGVRCSLSQARLRAAASWTWANSAHRSHLLAIRFQLPLVSGSREAPAVYSHWAAYRINSSEGTIGQPPMQDTSCARHIWPNCILAKMFRIEFEFSQAQHLILFQAHHLTTVTWHLNPRGPKLGSTKRSSLAVCELREAVDTAGCCRCLKFTASCVACAKPTEAIIYLYFWWSARRTAPWSWRGIMQLTNST